MASKNAALRVLGLGKVRNRIIDSGKLSPSLFALSFSQIASIIFYSSFQGRDINLSASELAFLDILTMRTTLFISSVFTLFVASPILAQYPKSPKRGLVSVSTNNPQDEPLFVKPNNGLTWYYNYGISPTPAYINLTQSDIEFVPMLWGVSNVTGSTFLKNITTLIDKGRNISHVLSFNEPDVNFTSKGSQVSPDAAAASWILNFDPLRKMGVKVGAPCVHANETGFAWLDKFYAACKKRKSNCAADFMNIHVFGNASEIDAYLTVYKKK